MATNLGGGGRKAWLASIERVATRDRGGRPAADRLPASARRGG